MVWREEAPGPQVAKRNQQPTAYCLGPASGCGLCAVAARSIKNTLMLKQGRQISRMRSSQSNSLADGRVYDRLEEETSQPPLFTPLILAPRFRRLQGPDGCFRTKWIHGRVGRHAFCFFLWVLVGIAEIRATLDEGIGF